MNKYLDLVNAKLTEYIDNLESDRLKEVIEYALFPGGKRFRPLLLLAILDDLSIDLQLGVNQAAAIEMIHNYSLIHDDLPAMDNDDYRRGRLTVHKKFGEADAILAADALLTDAFLYFANGTISDSKKIEIIKLASIKAGGNGMVYGQVLDIDASNKDIDLDFVKLIHEHKTRDLISLAIISGGIIADLSKEKLTKLSNLANYFGIAFQIKDDIDDYNETNSDLINDKATYPKVLGLDKSKQLLSEYKESALRLCLELFGEKMVFEIIKRIL